MKLLRAGITLLVLMCNNLLINGQNADGPKPETDPVPYTPPLSDESSRTVPVVSDSPSKMNFSEGSMKILIENYKELNNDDSKSEVSPSLQTPPLEVIPGQEEPDKVNSTTTSTIRSRSSEPVTRHVPILMDERAAPYPSSSPYNVKPGIKSKYYDTSGLYWKSNSSLIEKFDVKAIYRSYLRHLKPKCNPYDANSARGMIKPSDIAAAVQAATIQVDREIAAAIADAKAGNIIASNVISADGRHLITGKLPAEISDFIDQEEAQYLEYVAKYLQSRVCIRPVDVIEKLTKIPVSSLKSKHLKCSRKHGNSAGNVGIKCRNSKYRSYDGFCNNLKHTFWGKSNICHVRFLPPFYQDGIYLPRTHGVSGHPLPSPRSVSLILHGSGEGETYYTPWHFTWGQYVIHDIMSTPQSVPSHGSGVQCCGSEPYDTSKCMPIMLTKEDVQAPTRKCINFIRSAPCPLCSIGPRQQINLATSYIDQSAMYGADNETAAGLRIFKGGLMKVGHDRFNKPILPDSGSPLTDQCSKPALGKDKVCFRSGDARVNQTPFIQLMHSIFLRRHNQHAQGLAKVNRYASDEVLFQEARRLTIAELQHITYNEYLPVLLGPEMGDYFNFHEKDSLFSDYEEDIDATTWNECAAAACRFGHSQVKSFMSIVQSNQKLFLKESFFDPKLVHSGLTPNLIATLLNAKSSVVDPLLSPTLKNYLYYHSGQDAFGSDLAAFNIQRGRDHGIPPYADYVKFCFGYTIRSWDDLFRFMPPEAVGQLRKVYHDFRDIDLFTGGLHEKKAIDADIGPTFACIVGIQFYHLKFGDRYFYSHQKEAGSFTPAQLSEIKNKVTLANLLCQIEPDLTYSQQYAFLLPSSYNPMMNCHESRKRYSINYNLWRGYF